MGGGRESEGGRPKLESKTPTLFAKCAKEGGAPRREADSSPKERVRNDKGWGWRPKSRTRNLGHQAIQSKRCAHVEQGEPALYAPEVHNPLCGVDTFSD